MTKRHQSIGIKQVVRLEWYDYALDMLLEGETPSSIRVRLDELIRERQQRGGFGVRGTQTYTKAVTQIMKSWVGPDADLLVLRDRAVQIARSLKADQRIALHWAMTIAAYPFWHQVAFQVGRLLNLQETITQNQIRQRCFEGIGERPTVERSARRVIRSFVTWGVLDDAGQKGCYRREKQIAIQDPVVAVLLLEAALNATVGGKALLHTLSNSPAFFPFQLPPITGALVVQQSTSIGLNRYGLDDEVLKLEKN